MQAVLAIHKYNIAKRWLQYRVQCGLFISCAASEEVRFSKYWFQKLLLILPSPHAHDCNSNEVLTLTIITS